MLNFITASFLVYVLRVEVENFGLVTSCVFDGLLSRGDFTLSPSLVRTVCVQCSRRGQEVHECVANQLDVLLALPGHVFPRLDFLQTLASGLLGISENLRRARVRLWRSQALLNLSLLVLVVLGGDVEHPVTHFVKLILRRFLVDLRLVILGLVAL